MIIIQTTIYQGLKMDPKLNETVYFLWFLCCGDLENIQKSI